MTYKSLDELPALLTKKEAAELMLVSLPTINRFIRDKKITFYKLDGWLIRVPKEEVIRFLDTCKYPRLNVK